MGTDNPSIYKYDGANFANPQTISVVTGIVPQKILYKDPYLLVPEKNAGGNVNIKFYQLNGGNSQWEQVTENTYSDTNFFNMGISNDHQWLAKVSSSETIVMKGSIGDGYTSNTAFTGYATGICFTPNNQVMLSLQNEQSGKRKVRVYVNCNYDTAKNFFYNSATSQCE